MRRITVVLKLHPIYHVGGRFGQLREVYATSLPKFPVEAVPSVESQEVGRGESIEQPKVIALLTMRGLGLSARNWPLKRGRNICPVVLYMAGEIVQQYAKKSTVNISGGGLHTSSITPGIQFEQRVSEDRSLQKRDLWTSPSDRHRK